MLAADTNVVVRLLVNDDDAQQRRVVARLDAARREGVAVLVTNVVLAEVSWVLDAVYRLRARRGRRRLGRPGEHRAVRL